MRLYEHLNMIEKAHDNIIAGILGLTISHGQEQNLLNYAERLLAQSDAEPDEMLAAKYYGRG